jgi:hypothetical protein
MVDKIWIVLPSKDGSGFTIATQKGHALVEFKYGSANEAESAAKHVQRAIINAVSVTPLGG